MVLFWDGQDTVPLIEEGVVDEELLVLVTGTGLEVDDDRGVVAGLLLLLLVVAGTGTLLVVEVRDPPTDELETVAGIV